jgi:hypothetical protein
MSVACAVRCGGLGYRAALPPDGQARVVKILDKMKIWSARRNRGQGNMHPARVYEVRGHRGVC